MLRSISQFAVVAAGLWFVYVGMAPAELHAILPKMSPLNPQYLSLKQRVFQKIAAFVEKFKGVGGPV
jgi:type I restriction enzyme R subunit